MVLMAKVKFWCEFRSNAAVETIFIRLQKADLCCGYTKRRENSVWGAQYFWLSSLKCAWFWEAQHAYMQPFNHCSAMVCQYSTAAIIPQFHLENTNQLPLSLTGTSVIGFCSTLRETEIDNGCWIAGIVGTNTEWKRSEKAVNVEGRLLGTSCCWHDTKVWKPGATPNPSWSMKGGSSWLWIWTLMPASYDVSSVDTARQNI